MPNKALTHIQNIAPGPPMAMAIATPAMLPMPTVLLMALIRAWKLLICPSPCCLVRSERMARRV